MGPEQDAVHDGRDDRFVVQGKLGAGGMGVVYRVLDRAHQREVALKTLRTRSARDVYRFKREFRALCDLAHPNLCALHELHTTGDEWFFTMELVRGVGFIDWVRPSSGSDQPHLDDSGSGDDDLDDDSVTRPGRPAPRSRTEILSAPVRLDRVEAALGQLCDGVHALHSAGKLHRDLKPSNVLVEPGGRVVLLDFGLVADVDAGGVDRTHERAAVGTPAYMSPEQAADTPLTPASDWYSVGVILYEALTGRRPIEGRADDVMRRKQLELPPAPRLLAPDTPAHLDALCTALLSPDPRDRPDGPAVLAALGREPSQATATVERHSGASHFVGRAAQLAELDQAVVDSRRAGVAVIVRGASGMGKSMLISRFLGQLGERTLVLSSRCYERDSVPYKTLDTLIDALTTALLGLPEEELGRILPRGVNMLGRLFPVLRRVPQVAGPELRRFQPLDPQELRRRAFSALTKLIGALAERGPLVVCVDDLQWGDLDSAGFLGDLISRPDRPRVLVVLVCRSDRAEGPVMTELHRRITGSDADVRVIDLPPLDPDDATHLVRKLATFEGDVDERASALIRDAGGNTLFLAELARSAATVGGASTLDELLRRRIARLPDVARSLLTACAVAGRPMPADVAARAAGVEDPSGALSLLRAERLVRAARADGEQLEPFHDRVRTVVMDDLATGEVRATHRSLAAAYQAATTPEREALVDHLLGAGESERAAVHAVDAAAASEEALAFRRAADLYAVALEYGSLDPHVRLPVYKARARALANAGQLMEAAATWAEAVSLAGPDERFELGRLRLEQMLRAGGLRVGMTQARAMLAELGYRLPATRRAATRKLILQRVMLRARGLRFKERTADQVPRERLSEVDILWSVASGLSFADPLMGKVVQMWHLRRALAAGEPSRICGALALEIGYLASTLGIRGSGRIDALCREARRVAERAGPFHVGLIEACTGLGHFLLGRWRAARDHLEAGLRVMRDHGVDARWEIDITELFHLSALYYLGEIGEMVRITPIMLREAEDRGDVYSQHGLRGWRSNLTWLALDKPADARAHLLAVALERGDVADFHLHDNYQLIANTQIDLYIGDGDGALARMEQAWPELERSYLLRIESVRIEALFSHGRAALTTALQDRDRRSELIAVARRRAAALRGEQVAWGQAVGALLHASVLRAEGDRAAAVEAYTDAEARFLSLDMHLFVRATRLARSELMPAGRGDGDREAAEAWMREQSIVQPLTMSRVLAPR